MALQVIGAGLPRTGTTSLKAAIERLTGEPCYHMIEFYPRAEEHGRLFWKAFDGDTAYLDEALAGFGSALDWPASLFWRELADRNPDALVIASHRASPDAWWSSVDATVWASMRRPSPVEEWEAFIAKMRTKAGFGDDWDDPEVAKARYVATLEEVRAAIPADRLLVWQPSDGWSPLCAALGVATPDEPFPHLNDTATFRAEAGLS
jgi:hypothetical protein